MTPILSALPKGAHMFSRSAMALLATLALGACDSLLDTSPPDQLSDDKTVTNAAGARTALAGAYAALQDGYYYGGSLVHHGDLYADNSVHTGTFTSYQEIDQHQVFADNGEITGIWSRIYEAIKRTNVLIQKVPGLTGFAPGEQDQILGEAFFLRALHYSNLVKYYGGVPLRLTPITDPNAAAAMGRSTEAEVYAQILADLGEAETRITNLTDPDNHATLGAVKALLARVYLYQGNYAQAVVKAGECEALGYTLAANYSDLFNGDAVDTPEDIFKLTFTLVQFNLHGYYWLSDLLATGAGRFEMGPTQAIIDAYDTLSTDARLTWNIAPDPSGGGYVGAGQNGGSYGTKWPSPSGTEDFQVLRFAEVMLIKAEGYARLNQLDSALAYYNPLRVRAAIAPHVLGVDVTTQQEVLDAITAERRLELFGEGDRFPDLVRIGQAQAVLNIQAFQEIFPIPQAEIQVAPNVVQNPGY